MGEKCHEIFFFLKPKPQEGTKKKCSFLKNWYNAIMDSPLTLMFTKIEFFIIDHISPKALKAMGLFSDTKTVRSEFNFAAAVA